MDEPKNDIAEWEEKLLGKVFLEDDAGLMVKNDQIVTAKDLPSFHRVIAPGTPVTRDLRLDRLNVFIDENGTVKRVYYG